MSSLLAARENILRSGRGATVPLHDIILDSAQSSIDFDNLIGDADAEYIVRAWIEAASAAALFPSMYINDDNTGTSYDILYETTLAASVTPSEILNRPEYNFTPSLLMNQGETAFIEMKIKGTSGIANGHNITSEINIDGASSSIINTSGNWDSVAEINKISLRSGAPFLTSTFAAGSRFQIFTF